MLSYAVQGDPYCKDNMHMLSMLEKKTFSIVRVYLIHFSDRYYSLANHTDGSTSSIGCREQTFFFASKVWFDNQIELDKHQLHFKKG